MRELGKLRSQNLNVLLVAFVALSAIAANAATFYVATTGHDGNDGSAQHPWRTVGHSVATMRAGDTTYVKEGTYLEPDVLWFKRSGTKDAPIRLLNAPGASPVIDFSQSKGKMGRLLLLNPAKNAAGAHLAIGWITVEGLEIKNGPAAFQLFNVHNLTIRRNNINHAISQGILGNGKDIVVDRNIIAYNGDPGPCLADKKWCNQRHGAYVSGSNWVFSNNLFFANLASGLQVAAYPWCEATQDCYGNGAKRYLDPSYVRATGFLISNNTFAYQDHGPGLTLWQGSNTNNTIRNNIFYENHQKTSNTSAPQISFWNSGKGHTVENNLFYATAPGGIQPIAGTTGWDKRFSGSGNIFNIANPKFVDAPPTISGTPNFALKAASPAIDKGLNSYALGVTTDFAGNQRPHNGPFEIGAYEFGAQNARQPSAPSAMQVE